MKMANSTRDIQSRSRDCQRWSSLFEPTLVWTKFAMELQSPLILLSRINSVPVYLDLAISPLNKVSCSLSLVWIFYLFDFGAAFFHPAVNGRTFVSGHVVVSRPDDIGWQIRSGSAGK